MRRRPVFQTDDIYDTPRVNQFNPDNTCGCDNPVSKGSLTLWNCELCNKRIRGVKRDALKKEGMK